MLSTPWNLVLTALFGITGLWCLIELVRNRSHLREAGGGLTTHTVVDVNHLVMSAAMIVMIHVSVVDAATWAQVIVFALFALALLPGFAAKSAAVRVSLASHVVLNLAMIWMLVAMPLLMAGSMTDSESSGHHHGAGDMGGIPSTTPAWADVVNVVFIAASFARAAWWLVALVRSRGRHLHTLCHALMAAGMGVMLIVMNG